MTYVRIRRKPPSEHKPPGRRARAPWESAASIAAGLPADRAAWLARVLPVVAAAPSMRAAATTLGVHGSQLGYWHAALVRLRAAGELPGVADIPSPPPPRPRAPKPQPVAPKPRRGRPPKPRDE